MKRNVVAALLLLAAAGTLSARVLYVPGPDSNAIQRTLDSTIANDTVLVAPGVYQETLNWPSRPNISLMSEYGPASCTINALGLRGVVRFPEIANLSGTVDGFTVTGGFALSPRDDGAGFFCKRAAPVIRNNAIVANNATSDGGGIHCELSASLIVGNIIHLNQAGNGGGVMCLDHASPIIRENVFSRNRAGEGGAMKCYDNCHPPIRYNRILDNEGVSGGGMYCGYYHPNTYHGSQPQTHYNDFLDNVTWEVCGRNHGTTRTDNVPADSNWWGDTANIEPRMSGSVDYTPWLAEPVVLDIGAQAIVRPPDTVNPRECSTYAPVVLVGNGCNFGCEVSFFAATCSISDGYVDYARVGRLLRPDSTVEVAFDTWIVRPSQETEYTMKVTLHYAVDLVPENDTISKRIVVVSSGAAEPAQPGVREVSFGIRPNPARGCFVASVPVHAARARLDIYDASGLLVRCEELAGGTHRIPTAGLAPGIYIVRLEADGFRATEKLVVQR